LILPVSWTCRFGLPKSRLTNGVPLLSVKSSISTVVPSRSKVAVVITDASPLHRVIY
jgi:hypothetical protein